MQITGLSDSVPGAKVGHFTNSRLHTGCSVVLCENGAVAGVDIRGSVLGTHEVDLVRSGQLVERVQAVVLTGRSAYGLVVVAGVMRFLRERDLGFSVPGVNLRVPIVSAASIFDIPAEGTLSGLDDNAGYEACLTATPEQFSARGPIGVGTGAHIAKRLDFDHWCASGIGSAVFRLDGLVLGALVVVDCSGNVHDTDSTLLAGHKSLLTDSNQRTKTTLGAHEDKPLTCTSTSIAVIVTDAPLTKAEANHMASSAFLGWSNCIRPINHLTDGFVTYVLSTAPSAKPSQSRGHERTLRLLELSTPHTLATAVEQAVRAHERPCPEEETRR